MPVLQGAICIYTDDDVLGDSLGFRRPPADHTARLRILHVSVQDERLVAGENVPNADFTVVAALRNILVEGIVADAERLGLEITKGETMLDFDVTATDRLQVEILRERQQVFFIFFSHSGSA